MSQSRRVSLSYSPVPTSNSSANLPGPFTSTKESMEFLTLCPTLAKDLIDGHIFEIDADVSVDAACESLIENDVPCLVVRGADVPNATHIGLFDCSDVNAFLTLAATSHLLVENAIEERISQILEAAKSGTGKVPVQLCTDLSEKNPLVTLPFTATILSLLQLFSRGAHRVVIEGPINDVAGIVSDIALVGWFMKHAPTNAALASTIAQPLAALGIGSRHVISCLSSDTVLDAMKLMSEQGLSSIAVTDAEGGDLLSAVSVTDIARLVAPSQSKKILSMPLGQFIALIKAPDGSRDGADRYPVFSVSQSSTLSHVIQKLLATNTHRVFITDDHAECARQPLRGVVSVVDVLSVFARLGGISDVDPTLMQRRRRASSSSSSSRSASASRFSGRSSMLSSVSSLEREGREPEKK